MNYKIIYKKVNIFLNQFRYLIIVISTASLIISLGLVIHVQIIKKQNSVTVDNNFVLKPSPEISKNNISRESLHFSQSQTLQNSPVSPSPLLQIPHIKKVHKDVQENSNNIDENKIFIPNKTLPNSSRISLNPSQIKQNLNHFSYSENIHKNLVKVAKYYDRDEFLDYETADAFKRMQLDAKNQGINLIIVSGFRSVSDQQKLFQKQIERRGSRTEAAKLSAPPGFSEHHTGFAMDIGDGNMPKTDLKLSFEETPAYLWLIQNAYHYGFELSFPPNNSQGVSFEPWHWRFVASERANQVFYEARKFYAATN